MVTNAQVIERVLRRLGNRTSPDLRSYAELEIVTKIQEYEQGPVLPWFLETTSNLTTAAGTEAVSLPGNFLREVEDGALRIQTTEGKWIELTKIPLDKLREEVVDEDSGLPEAYAIFGTSLYLGPVPDAAYPLRFEYYKKSEEFSDDESPATDWCAHATNLVIFGAAAQIAATYLLNDGLAGSLAALEERARTALYIATEARQNTGLNLNIED